MTIKSRISNKLAFYESTPNQGRFFKFCSLSKRPSMPILNNNIYTNDKFRNNDIGGDNNSFRNQEYLGVFGSITDRPIRKRFMSTESLGKLENEGSVLTVYDTLLLKYQNASLPFNNALDEPETSIISTETTELSISRCNEVFKLDSHEEVLSDQSDTQSLENVLDTFKFPGCIDKGMDKALHSYHAVQPECTALASKENNEQSYIRQDIARRKLKYSASKIRNPKIEMNIEGSVDSSLSLNETFSIEFLIEFKHRLKAIRNENLTISLMKKHIHNGNRLSRVLNYCFLIR